LDADSVVFDGEDAAEVAGEIEDESTAERLARDACACAAGVKWKVVLSGVADRGNYVVDRARTDDAQGFELVDAAVAGVEICGDVVAQHVTLQQASQVFLDSLLFWVHAWVDEGECSVVESATVAQATSP
jgi:hypothetical protein